MMKNNLICKNSKILIATLLIALYILMIPVNCSCNVPDDNSNRDDIRPLYMREIEGVLLDGDKDCYG